MEKIEIKKLDNKIFSRSQFEEAAYLLKAISHETRLCVIMKLTKSGELSVGELQDGMECEQSLLSHHLTDMRAKGILDCHKKGRHNYYSIKDKRISKVLSCLMECDLNYSELNLS